MSIQKKILLIFIITFVMLMSVLFTASHFFLLDKFAGLERRDVQQNVLRFLAALDNDQITLNQKVGDWANWDDTYNYIGNGNRQYEKSNLGDDTFKSLQLNMILFLDNQGRIGYGKFFDLQAGKEIRAMDAPKRYVAGRIMAAFHKKRIQNGIIILPEGPLMMAANSILTSEKKGPSRGILVMGCFLNRFEIQRLSKITHLQVEIKRYQPFQFKIITKNASFDQKRSIYIKAISDKQIAGYAILNDLSGKAAFVVSINQPRIIYHQGVLSITYYTLAILAIGIIFIILVLIYLKLVILDRLASFNDCIDSIAASSDLTIRIPKGGHDELTNFAELMNRMMDNLQLSNDGLRRYQILSEQVHDIILFMEMGGRIIEANEAAVQAYGYTREEFLTLTIFNLLQSQGMPREQLEQVNQAGLLFEGIHYRKDGSSFPVEVNLRGMDFGDKRVLLSIARDISDRKRADQALKESEEKFRLVFHNNTDSIFVEETPQNGRLGRIIEVNETACRVWGYSREEFLKMSVSDLDTQENMQQMSSVFKELQQKGRVVFERVGFTKDKTRIDVEIAAHSFKLNGKPVLLSVVRDIVDRKRAEEKLQQSMVQLRNNLKAAINALASATEMRDPYTAGHQERVTRFAVAIAVEMGLSEEQKEGIQIASAVHDIGKLAIPAEILSKPTKLSETEYALIKIHPQVGFTILSKIEFPWPIADIVHQHHERINGSGYPRGLTGKEILLEAKILCVADVIEAISSHRPYRPALGMDKALEEITLHKGVLYDPDVVDACQKLILRKEI